MKIVTRLMPRHCRSGIPAINPIIGQKNIKPRGTGVITKRHQAYHRSVLCHAGLFVDTYFYDSPTEAVQAGAVYELYNSKCLKEKLASGRRPEKDFLHPTLGMLYAADVFDY